MALAKIEPKSDDRSKWKVRFLSSLLTDATAEVLSRFGDSAFDMVSEIDTVSSFMTLFKLFILN